MIDHILAIIFGGVGGVLTVGGLHLVRVVGAPRRKPAPIDLSAYRIPSIEE